MSAPDPSGTPAPGRARRARGAEESLAQIVLGFESVIVFLGGLAAYGLGALPDAVPQWWGIVAGSMLALGRALGETIAVLIILFAATKTSIWSLFDSGYTFASKIASAAAEFDNVDQRGAYIAAGLVLFVLTYLYRVISWKPRAAR